MPKTKDPILTGKVCPYCGKPSEYTDSAEVYGGKSYGPIYLCRDCQAWVGCYNGTDQALGRLANAELRDAKRRAHHYLDQIWSGNKHKRYSTYKWLSEQLGIPRDLTHIGMSDVEQCNKIAEISIKRLKDDGIDYLVWDDDKRI